MKLKTLGAAALAAALLTGGCGGDEAAEASDTSDLTRTLLTQPSSDGLSTPVGPGVGSQGQEAPQDAPSLSVAEIGINRGESDAPVKVVELSDYGCSYCRKFHQETFPTLLEDFIESGMVEWKFVPYVTGMFEHSLAATEAAECVYVQDVDAFEALNQRLWADQADWKQSSDPDPLVRGWISELGVEMDTFDACLAADERIDRIAAATSLARRIGVRGTPTFVVIGYPPLQGALPLEMFQEILTLVYNEVSAQTGQ